MKWIFIFFMTITGFLKAQIVIDENFTDWNDGVSVFLDKEGDGTHGIDFRFLKIDNDSKYLYLSFDTDREINLQKDDPLALFIDIDTNEDTGRKINGIGADIAYFFAEKYGLYYRNGNNILLNHDDIELMPLPTVSSDTFELAIKRKFSVQSYLINLSHNIKMVLVHDIQHGDKIPDGTGGVEYIMKDKPYVFPPYSIKKSNPSYLRIMSYNIEKDNFFSNEPPYKRLIKAGEADILCFQELYDHSAYTVKERIERYFGGNWYGAKEGDDLIIISKYPVKKSRLVGTNAAFLVDVAGRDMLIINVHLYCCNKDDKRQKEVDEIMAFIRNAKAGKGPIPLKDKTPVIILGDMNFVSLNRQRKTLIEGDISNENIYGPDFLPDWDNTFYEDAKPIATATPAAFTWYSPYSRYPRGRLDYVIYSGSVLQKQNAFALYTAGLERDTLDLYRLNATDTENASDHLPVFIDFSFKNPDGIADVSKPIGKVTVAPNPVSDMLQLHFSLKAAADTGIRIVDINGKLVKTIYTKAALGQNRMDIDVSNLPEGIYFIQILDVKNGVELSLPAKFVKI